MTSLFTSSSIPWKPNFSTGAFGAFNNANAVHQPTIKCSDCSQEVCLDDLGSHVCSKTSQNGTHPASSETLHTDRPPTHDARFRAKASGLKITTSTASHSSHMLQSAGGPLSSKSARSPLGTPSSQWGRLSPRPQMERAASTNTTLQAPVSPGPGSSPSPSLPFFDKYNKIYGSAHSPVSASSSFGGPRSPSIGQQSQPNSANQSTLFTNDSYRSSLDGDSHRMSSVDEANSRCTSPDTFSSLYAGVVSDSPDKNGDRKPFVNISSINEAGHDTTSVPKYPQPFFSASKREPNSLTHLASPPARKESKGHGKGLKQLDDLLEGFDINQQDEDKPTSTPDPNSRAQSLDDDVEEDFTSFYGHTSPPPPPKQFDLPSAHAGAEKPLRPGPQRQHTVEAVPRTVRCANCHQNVPKESLHVQRSSDECDPSPLLCQPCYSQLYLPKCQKCSQSIEGKAIGCGDGKVKGKFHPGCFSCFQCSEPFPTGEFYVYEEKPYCYRHYHSLAGSICFNCEDGIEGPCVSLHISSSRQNATSTKQQQPLRYHVEHFTCSSLTCDILLSDYHYVVNDLPFCEEHANQRSNSSRHGAGRPEKRKTLVSPIRKAR